MRTVTMQRTALSLSLSLSLLCLAAAPAVAETGFQFSALGAQAPPDPDVGGLRISLLYGKNTNVSGFDLGMVSLSESTNTSGISVIWGLGRVTGRSSGLASSFVNIHSGEDTGANAAFINSINTMKSGINIGFVNLTDGYSQVDLSGLGISKHSSVQVGFINVTQRIDTVQIGFLNFAENGFFPVFPFFNFPKD